MQRILERNLKMIEHCQQCDRDGTASAIIPGICTACANEIRGICLNPFNDPEHGN